MNHKECANLALGKHEILRLALPGTETQEVA